MPIATKIVSVPSASGFRPRPALLVTLCAVAVATAVSCADEEVECTVNADCVNLGPEFVCGSGQCVPPVGGSTATDTNASGTDAETEPEADDDEGPGSSETTDGESTTAGTDGPTTGTSTTTSTSTTTTTEGDGFVTCDPQSRAFGMATGAPQAAMTFDFDAMGCAASGVVVAAPQVILDVRPTGLIDITADGIAFTDSLLGTYIDETSVTGIPSEVTNTVEATLVGDGRPVTFQFRIGRQGPLLENARANFSGG